MLKLLSIVSLESTILYQKLNIIINRYNRSVKIKPTHHHLYQQKKSVLLRFEIKLSSYLTMTSILNSVYNFIPRFWCMIPKTLKRITPIGLYMDRVIEVGNVLCINVVVTNNNHSFFYKKKKNNNSLLILLSIYIICVCTLF